MSVYSKKGQLINTGVEMANPKQINQGQDRKKGIAQCLKENKSQSRGIAVSNMIGREGRCKVAALILNN